jgi:hypothetical protein
VLEGTVTNASAESLPHVSLVYGNGVELIGAMGPGETRAVRLQAVGGRFSELLTDRLFGGRPDLSDPEAAREFIARRAIVQHLSGGFNEQFGVPSAQTLGSGPVILAFRSGSTLDIDVGTSAQRLGETLFVLPAHVTVTGPVTFAGGLIGHTLVEADALDALEEGTAFTMGRGTMTMDYWPVGIEGAFDATGLSIRLDHGENTPPTTGGVELLPVPADQQPDPDLPLASNPHPEAGLSEAPDIQLLDRVAGTWIEFQTPSIGRSYRIAEPERFVDSSGGLRVRFVGRDSDSYYYFSLTVRLEGTVQ